jgi:pteridine reductase
MNLQGKTALITGAARRIGREIALTLASQGASILIHYRESKKEAEELKNEICILGANAFLVSADFSHTSKPILPTVQKFLKNVYKQTPRIDILINNASVFYPTPFGKISEKDWDDILSVNLKVPFFLAQELGLRMAEQKSGKIVNLVDWVGERPYGNFLPYSISKAGLINMTKGLAKVLAPYVQVVGIAPGPILPAKGMKKKDLKVAANRTLLKHFGDPRDIARTVRFIVEDTDFITGAIIPVEGGALLA